LEEGAMRAAARRAAELASEIGARHRVRFDLGDARYSYSAVLDIPMRQHLGAIAQSIGLPVMELASGAGHDSAVFAEFGVRTGMIFIRNSKGSHNPEEAMALEDFAVAARLLATFIAADALT